MKFDPTDNNQVLKAIKSTGKNIKYVSNPSDDLCLQALKNGASLFYFKNPSFNVISTYLKDNLNINGNYYLEFFYKNYEYLITKKLIVFAAKHLNTYKMVWKILEKTSYKPIYLTKIGSVTDLLVSICYNEPHLINYIIETINEDNKLLCLFPELIKTEEQIQCAITENYMLPQLDFKALSDKTIKLLLKNNAIKYLQMIEQTEERCLFAVKQDLNCLKFVDNPRTKVLEYCFIKKPDSYFLIENPSEEATKLHNLITILK